MNKKQAKLLFIVLDGWGINKKYPGNAIAQAETPFFDQLWQENHHAELKASGKAIGLPEGQMGTSEVNHFIFGAGRVVLQYLSRINQDIKNQTFSQKPALQRTFSHVKKNNSALHIWGLASDGGVHSHLNHLLATLKAAESAGLEKIYLHAVTDGRDTSPTSGIDFIEKLKKTLKNSPSAKLATIVGRYYAMDRENNWDRTERAVNLYLQGEGKLAESSQKAIKKSYQNDITDEFIKPILLKPNSPRPPIQKNDAIIMVNFRNDRTRQLTKKFLEQGPENLFLTTMTQYNPSFPAEVVYPPIKIETTLGKAISEAGLSQLRVTETAKFAHMTYFLNCKREKPYKGEDRIMLDTYSNIPTHNKRPQMRAPDIAKAILQDIQTNTHPAIFTNLCNADMVGHSGNIQATIKGCEAVDQVLQKIIPEARSHGFHIIVTADHGNAEEMLDRSGKTITAHSTNPVPFILISKDHQKISQSAGSLADIAPTILTLLNIKVPQDMTGKSLI